MQPLLITVLVCGGQVTIMALLGVAASWLLMRTRPTLAHLLACSTLAMIGVISLSAPFPMPIRFDSLAIARSGIKANCVASPAPVESTPLVTPTEFPRHTDASEAHTGVNWTTLLDRLRGAVSRDDAESEHSWAAAIVLAIVFSLSLVGGARVFTAVRFADDLCRSSRPISDTGVINLSTSIARQLRIIRRVRLRESAEISHAAVTGWFRPTILLPVDRTDWSDAEVRSVIAHELAHISSRDCFWRAASCLVATLHYYNPLVHFLARHIAMVQEISADMTAASIVGPQVYVRALSSLALRQQGKDAFLVKTGLYPVFSGHLIRRIKMLKSRKVWGGSKELRATKLCGVSVIVVVGTLTMMTRGLAQTPELSAGSSDGNVIHVASIPRDRELAQPDPTTGMFRRAHTNPDEIRENDWGMIKVQLADITGRPEMVPILELINRDFAGGLKQAFSSPDAPALDLRAIKVAYGTFKLTTYRPRGYLSNALYNEVDDVYVRFREPVDLSKWLGQYSPTAKSMEQGGRMFHELPRLPQLCVNPVMAANRDSHTVCFSNIIRRTTSNEGDSDALNSLMKVVTHHNSPNRSSWAAAFRRVDGGLVSVAVSNKAIRTPRESSSTSPEGSLERIVSDAVNRIEHTFDTLACGLDAADDGRDLGIRVRIGGRNRIDTEAMAADVQLWRRTRLQLVEGETAGSLETPGTARLKLEVWKQFMERMVVDVEDHPDGSSDIFISTTVPFQSVISLWIQPDLGSLDVSTSERPTN